MLVKECELKKESENEPSIDIRGKRYFPILLRSKGERTRFLRIHPIFEHLAREYVNQSQTSVTNKEIVPLSKLERDFIKLFEESK